MVWFPGAGPRMKRIHPWPTGRFIPRGRDGATYEREAEIPRDVGAIRVNKTFGTVLGTASMGLGAGQHVQCTHSPHRR